MKLLSGVPRGISTRPVFWILPTSEKTLVPGLLALPVSENHCGPRLTMGAMLHQVSTLLILVGLPYRPFCAGNGGRGICCVFWTDITFSGGRGIHVDQHAIVFDSIGHMYVGNDGGIDRKSVV